MKFALNKHMFIKQKTLKYTDTQEGAMDMVPPWKLFRNLGWRAAAKSLRVIKSFGNGVKCRLKGAWLGEIKITWGKSICFFRKECFINNNKIYILSKTSYQNSFLCNVELYMSSCNFCHLCLLCLNLHLHLS